MKRPNLTNQITHIRVVSILIDCDFYIFDHFGEKMGKIVDMFENESCTSLLPYMYSCIMAHGKIDYRNERVFEMQMQLNVCYLL